MFLLFLVWHTIDAFSSIDSGSATIRLQTFEKAAATVYVVLGFLVLSCGYLLYKDSPQLVRLASRIAIVVGFMTFSIEVANTTLFFLLKNDIITTCQQYILITAFPNDVDTSPCVDFWDEQAPRTVLRAVIGVSLSMCYPITVHLYARSRLREGDHLRIPSAFGEKNSDIRMQVTSYGRTSLRGTINSTLQRTRDAFASKIALTQETTDDAKDREAMLPFQHSDLASHEIPTTEKYSLPESHGQEDKHEDLGDRIMAREYV